MNEVVKEERGRGREKCEGVTKEERKGEKGGV